jgi:hypothetical protein
MEMELYIVMEFCYDIEHEMLHQPHVSIYTNKDEALKAYNHLKDIIIDIGKSCNIIYNYEYDVYDNEKGETIIQDDIGRKIGISFITKKTESCLKEVT